MVPHDRPPPRAEGLALLDGRRRDDVLDLLEEHWTGERSYELERRLRESDIPIKRFLDG